ncbi:MAG TPA: HEAT repeat domain-containing protein, partial [Ktedonobacterales bacterium]
KARRAIVAALGSFQESTKPEMAAKAASVLHTLLERGEPSYYVEASALYALGRTRTAKAYDRLVSWLDKSSFNEVLRGGACHGLGELGEARVAPVLTELLLDKKKPMDARAVAAQGLGTLARTKRLDPSEAQTQAVEALCAALEDEWELVHFAAIPALADFADARAIGPLERFIARSVDERSARMARRVVLRLRRGTNTRDETKKLRGDVEDLREENRKVRDQMRALEARLEAPAKNGATPAKRATARAGKAEE